MSHMTPAVYLVWGIVSSLLGAFLFWHLWKFDRFKCLKLNNAAYSGAFKRLMTYTYLLSVPGIITYSLGFAVIKYQEGFTVLPGYGIIPVPWELWSGIHKSAILPLYLIFTISWSLEMVTHLEELCFWLFLIHSSSVQQNWFKSLYFKTWIAGSLVAITYMPLVTVFMRHDPLKCEAYTFLAGSLGSLSLTIWFMPVLWTFPKFIRTLKRSGVDIQTIVRLTNFHELNCVRVVFRFLFVVPLLVLAVDGVKPHSHAVNESPFWTELLAMVSAIGCVVSSAITLVIFFPRSKEAEIQTRSRNATRDRSHSRLGTERSSLPQKHHSLLAPDVDPGSPMCGREGAGEHVLDLVGEYPPSYSADTHSAGRGAHHHQPPTTTYENAHDAHDADAPMPVSPSLSFSPNRRVAEGVVAEGRVVQPQAAPLTARALATHDAHGGANSGVHPIVANFTSPIEVMFSPEDVMEGSPNRWYVKRRRVWQGAYAV